MSILVPGPLCQPGAQKLQDNNGHQGANKAQLPRGQTVPGNPSDPPEVMDHPEVCGVMGGSGHVMAPERGGIEEILGFLGPGPFCSGWLLFEWLVQDVPDELIFDPKAPGDPGLFPTLAK